MKKASPTSRTDQERWDFMTGIAVLIEAHLRGWPVERRFNSSHEAVIVCLKMILEKFPKPEKAKEDPQGFAVWYLTTSLLDALVDPEFGRRSPGDTDLASPGDDCAG